MIDAEKLKKLKWEWPVEDVDYKKVAFSEFGLIDKALQYSDKRGCVIQAGGALGLWPVALSELFKEVYTFEPCPYNYGYLNQNIRGIKNINAQNYGLSDWPEEKGIERNPKNLGAQRITKGSGVLLVMIDDIGLSPDFIFLDIEGYEYKALKGAEETIRKNKPVITVESKGLCKDHGIEENAVYDFLKSLGYERVEKLRRDEIYVYKGNE